MILLMVTKAQHRCDAIRINLFPQKIADDSCSLETQKEIVQSARQMGSYIVTLKDGVVEKLIDPNNILDIFPNHMGQML